MQKPTASPPTMQYIAKKRKECKAKGIEAATSLLPGAPSERGNPRFVLWDTPGAKVAALGEVSIDDGAPHGAVAQAWVPSICPCVDTSGNDAYSAVADKYQPSAGSPVFYGTSFTCSKPTIVDVPLNYIQVMMNSLVPQRGPSFCCCKPTSACCGGETDDHSSCGKCCTGCLVNITKCALATQCYEQHDVEFFETHEEALEALLALPHDPAVPEELTGVWSFEGNPWGEQLVSFAVFDFDKEKYELRGDHIFIREGWIERGDACGALQQCLMALGAGPGTNLYFPNGKDGDLVKGTMNLTLDCRCCPGAICCYPCTKVLGPETCPNAAPGYPGYCIQVCDCINANSFTSIGKGPEPGGMNWRNRQSGFCGLPMTCCNFSYTARRVATKNGPIEPDWELYKTWVEARSGTQRTMRMKTTPFKEYPSGAPDSLSMGR